MAPTSNESSLGEESGEISVSISLEASHCDRELFVDAVSICCSFGDGADTVRGLLQSVIFVYDVFAGLLPDEIDWVLGADTAETWSEDLTADIQPLRCHSHNDYWRREPFYGAIHAGCASVEADVWSFDDELFVGHTVGAVRKNKTLTSLYLDPLLTILDRQNLEPEFPSPMDSPRSGVFDTDPTQSLILLVDFKNDPEATWDQLHSRLGQFRERKYLTYFNGTSVVPGPVTVVVSGDAPFHRVVQNPVYRDIFFDAPLDLMANLHMPEPPPDPPSFYHRVRSLFSRDTDKVDAPIGFDGPDQGEAKPKYPQNPAVYSAANSYYASVSFMKSIGYPWHSTLSRPQLDLMRRQIRGAHARGLKVRYWGIPAWPIGLRNYLWRVLVREGVDYLNVDDIRTATHGDWGPRKGGWGKKWWR